jgi:hypothetical protein
LTEVTKGGLIKAKDPVDLVASPKMQQHFQWIGISKPSISEITAQRWLVQLGWQYGRHASGMYIDGHEQEDVVKYRHAFVGCWAEYKLHFNLDSTENPLPFTLPVIAGLSDDPICQGSEGPWHMTVLRDRSRVAERMSIRPLAYKTSHDVMPVE